ncbi:MAG: hypothetical protein JRD05_00695 [Deltaproteobacteria bacterium]|nr:hypothetical protein [Deltaproteobacteria bacterium]
MRGFERILLFALAGLMFLFFLSPTPAGSRFSWQIVSIWLAGAAFISILSNLWLMIFFFLAMVQVVVYGPIILSYISLFMIGIFISAIEGYMKMPAQKIMDWMACGALILVAWKCCQMAGILSGFNLGESAAGPFNRISASIYLGASLPAFFRGRIIRRDAYKVLWFQRARPLCWYHLLPIVVFGVFICKSTTGFMTATAAVSAYSLLGANISGKKIIAGIAAVAVLSGIFFIRFDPAEKLGNDPRLHVWKRVVWTYGSEARGRGLGSFSQIFPRFTASDKEMTAHGTWRNAHNEYLQVGFEMGFQAIVLIILFLGHIARQAWQNRKILTQWQKQAVAGVAAIATACMGFNMFHIEPLALLGCAWIGMWMKGMKEGKRLKAEG